MLILKTLVQQQSDFLICHLSTQVDTCSSPIIATSYHGLLSVLVRSLSNDSLHVLFVVTYFCSLAKICSILLLFSSQNVGQIL